MSGEPDLPRELARLRRHAALLEGMLDVKTQELSLINQELEQRVETRTAELREALTAANAADEAKRSFLSHVSHELRTPLQAINGLAEVIESTTAEARTRERIAVVHASGLHMLSLVEQLLDLSWLDRDEMPLDQRPTSIGTLIGGATSLLGVKAAAKGLAMQCELGDLPGPVLADATRLREVLLNFAGNAIKYTTEGAVTIGCRAVADGDGVTLHWRVADTGCGMDAETLANVFEPFYQARDTYRREHGGAGLGMAISRRIVQAMGGEVRVESEVGRGTTVQFTTRHTLAASAPTPPPSSSAAAALRPGVRMLVVDDQPANCLVAEAVLGLLGGQVETLCDAEAARERATEAFDVLIFDYHMPKLDGCELVRGLRAAGVRTPALLATADATDATRAAAAAAGFDGLLLKPFDVARAGAAIAGVLANGPGEVAAAPLPSPPPPAADEALFAVAATVARLGGHVAILQACVAAYLESAPEVLAQLQRREHVRRAAHALKGSAANVGAELLAACARRVEQGDDGPLDDGELFALAERSDAAMRAWLADA
ncbi:MAG: ATP-binding protein [Planctomycetota bacterium]